MVLVLVIFSVHDMTEMMLRVVPGQQVLTSKNMMCGSQLCGAAHVLAVYWLLTSLLFRLLAKNVFVSTLDSGSRQ